MSKYIALCTLLSFSAFAAEPSSNLVKEGVIVDAETGATLEVKGGLYLNDEAASIVRNTLIDQDNHIKVLEGNIKKVNAEIEKCEGRPAGVPIWVPIVVGAVLSVATAGVTAYAVTRK